MQNQSNYYECGQFITRERYRQTFLKNTLTRTVANLVQSLVASTLVHVKNLFSKQQQQYKYTVCICGIFKNEAQYLEEWINYHQVIGVDHFYLYNNNSDDDYSVVLQPFIDRGIVDLVEWPLPHSQMLAYRDCYNNHREDTQWLTFIDIDEFICPISTDNIKDWLASYISYPGVAVYWKQFGSNGKLTHDPRQLVIEQYTQCWRKFSCYTKMFCNMNFVISDFQNPHVLKSEIMGISIPPINQFKKIISFGTHRVSWGGKETIQINHYWGKAYDCFTDKINKTDVHYSTTNEVKQLRKQLLESHEAMCLVRDFTIQRFLLYTKLMRFK